MRRNGSDEDHCPACRAADPNILELPYPPFRHLDFTRTGEDSLRLGECGTCGTIFRIALRKTLDEIDALYRSEAYADHEEVHAISLGGSAAPVPASRIQARALAGVLPTTAPRILDFGCFNGRLLQEFQSLRPDAQLVGYDVEERKGFPADRAFTFISGDWRDIEGSFDLVSLSHSIQYVREIGDLLRQIRDWIGGGGVVFIQAPDVTRKPCALLLGDLHYHFSPASLRFLMARFGFETTSIPDLPFTGDIALLGRPAVGNSSTSGHHETRNTLEWAIGDIGKLAEAATAHADRNVAGILGTTIEAAFVDELLNGKPRFFVDENPERVGTKFRRRPVISPADATRGAEILVPLAARERAVTAAARLANTYQADFLPL